MSKMLAESEAPTMVIRPLSLDEALRHEYQGAHRSGRRRWVSRHTPAHAAPEAGGR